MKYSFNNLSLPQALFRFSDFILFTIFAYDISRSNSAYVGSKSLKSFVAQNCSALSDLKDVIFSNISEK